MIRLLLAKEINGQVYNIVFIIINHIIKYTLFILTAKDLLSTKPIRSKEILLLYTKLVIDS